MISKLIAALAFSIFLSASLFAQNEFITTWNTSNPGSSADNQITIPVTAEGYHYDIYWEDADSPEINGNLTNEKGGISLSFPAPGIYRIKISGDFPRIYFNNEGDRQKILSVEQWGDIAWSSMAKAFHGCTNLVVPAADAPDLSNVTDMSGMFYGASSFNGDISAWDVSKVTDMSNLFQGAGSFNQDIGSWDVGNVWNMMNMFSAATSFNQDISGWDVSKVGVMNEMFFGARSFNQDIGSWNVGNVQYMTRMFVAAESFNQNIGDWDVSQVTDMRGMFNFATSFNGDIGGWDVSNVIDMSNMFHGAGSFNQDIGRWDVGNVTDMSYMFYSANSPFSNSATSFNQNIGGWNVSNVTDMSYMFRDVSLSSCNYDALLTGWSKQSLQKGVTFDAGNSHFSSGAVAAKQSIISDFGWTISDGGETTSDSETEITIKNNVSCGGLSEGSLEVVTSTEAVAHNWYNENEELLGNEAILTGVTVGRVYTVKTELVSGCTISKTINVAALEVIEISGSVKGPEIEASATGGSGNYTFFWEGPDGFSSDKAAISGNAEGEYTLTVKDDKGCEATRSFAIITLGVALQGPLEVKIFPNPAGSYFYLQTDFTKVKSMKLFDIRGRLVSMANVGQVEVNAIDISHLNKGLYVYHLSDRKGNVLKSGKLNVVK